MKKFNSTPTEKYVPLSHENVYLFNYYDRISNFLNLNLDKRYKNILAKPIKNNYEIEWYAPFDGLILTEQSEYKQYGMQVYWEFQEKLERKIAELSNTHDANTQNWVSILKKVFHAEDNIIYCNGKDISIIWGWKFENNQMRVSNILDAAPPLLVAATDVDKIENKDNDLEPLTQITKADDLDDAVPASQNREVSLAELFGSNAADNEPEKKQISDTKHSNKSPSFLEFLRYFAAKYWWLLLLLLLCICLVFFYKSLSA